MKVSEAEELYHINGWADGLYSIRNGHLHVHPEPGHDVDLVEVIEALREEGQSLPVVLRFPQILGGRMERLHHAFRAALKDNGLNASRYRGVFPIKVNQRKDVVQELARRGRKWQYGLEVGSKAELVAALTMDPNRKSLLIVNGFKDREFLEAACLATHFKDDVVIVLDEVGELPHLIEIMERLDRKPIIGLRLKLRSKAPGKWALSGGERAKFGLTIPEVQWAVKELEKAGRLDRLQLLHFHIGSQISNIRRIAQGVREAARIFVELKRLGVPLQYLDCGGGQGVDYDGSGSSGANSCNYNMEEYANTVVATIKDVCDDAEVDVPDIISESGRAVVTHHALLVMDVMRRVPYLEPKPDLDGRKEDDPTPLWNLYDLLQDIGPKNAFETFHDVIQHRDDLHTLFDLGHLDLDGLGRAEALSRAILAKVKQILEAEDETESEEYRHCRSLLGQKLVCNFSLFQSLPDVWGVKQQFPIMPIHRLDERPTEVATLADITCDSDGEIRAYIDPMGTAEELPVHAFRPGDPYWLCVPFVGAYQDALGDYHNLFGETAEAAVVSTEDGWSLQRVHEGSKVQDMLSWVHYEPADLRKRMRGRIQRLVDGERIDKAAATDMRKRFEALLRGGTYLRRRDAP